MSMDAPSRSRNADLSNLRARLDDLSRRRVEALARPTASAHSKRHRQLEAMRFELAELDWHLTQLESR